MHQIDHEMTNFIKSYFNEKDVIILQEQCNKQCQTGGLKSMQEFSKKNQWVKENVMSTSKPRHKSVRDPNKQKNKIQYQTYYRNDYNRDKNNRRNNYRSNSVRGGEQQRYNRNPRQNNSNKVITFKQAKNNYQINESTETGDTLAEVLTLISRRTSSTEAVTVSETPDDDRMDELLVNTPFQ